MTTTKAVAVAKALLAGTAAVATAQTVPSNSATIT
jgi:hypothetical protein